MTEWPKNPVLNIGSLPPPSGPVNVFNEKLASAEAINRATDVKTKYDTIHPPGTPITPTPPDPGTPISPGGPITLADDSQYMIDVNFTGNRVIPRRN